MFVFIVDIRRVDVIDGMIFISMGPHQQLLKPFTNKNFITSCFCLCVVFFAFHFVGSTSSFVFSSQPQWPPTLKDFHPRCYLLKTHTKKTQCLPYVWHQTLVGIGLYYSWIWFPVVQHTVSLTPYLYLHGCWATVTTLWDPI